jgi:hypothetical protein
MRRLRKSDDIGLQRACVGYLPRDEQPRLLFMFFTGQPDVPRPAIILEHVR